MNDEPKRNSSQNSKGWAMWTDLSRQLTYYGHTLDNKQWKELLSIDWGEQTDRLLLVPSISGNHVCLLGASTSGLKKREFAELIEITYAYGNQEGVIWSEPALKAYEEYRESQN